MEGKGRGLYVEVTQMSIFSIATSASMLSSESVCAVVPFVEPSVCEVVSDCRARFSSRGSATRSEDVILM